MARELEIHHTPNGIYYFPDAEGKVVEKDGRAFELFDGDWQCGECGRIHEYPCQACCCLTGEMCDCGQFEE